MVVGGSRLEGDPMGLTSTKHEYIDRDIAPDLLALIRLAEAISPRVLWLLLVVGVITSSQWVVSLFRWARLQFRQAPNERNRVPTITWPLPENHARRRASDPGPVEASLRGVNLSRVANSPPLLTGLAQLLREGLRNRGGFWARMQWK